MSPLIEGSTVTVLPDAVRAACRVRLRAPKQPVRVLVCTARAGQADEATRRLAMELAALSPAVKLELLDRDRDLPLFDRYGIERTPAVVLMTGGVEIGDTGIRFYGRPTPALARAPRSVDRPDRSAERSRVAEEGTEAVPPQPHQRKREAPAEPVDGEAAEIARAGSKAASQASERRRHDGEDERRRGEQRPLPRRQRGRTRARQRCAGSRPRGPAGRAAT